MEVARLFVDVNVQGNLIVGINKPMFVKSGVEQVTLIC